MTVEPFEDEPLPSRHVRIRTAASAISLGTELAMIRSDEPRRVGYSASGVVSDVGEDVRRFRPGDRVAAYGAPYVGHATALQVPETLVAAVPDRVPLELAAFGGLGAIAIHAVRLAEVQFGERVLVVGLGPLGRLCAAVARAAGLSVQAVEPNEARAGMAGEVAPVATIPEAAGGFDAVLLSAHGSADLVDAAVSKLRSRGSLVVVGDVPVAASRARLFAKEVRIVVSRAGGPGRYDRSYERDAVDYPLDYVRWTEGRNVQLFVDWLDGRIDLGEWITHEASFEEAPALYARLVARRSEAMGVVLAYAPPEHEDATAAVEGRSRDDDR